MNAEEEGTTTTTTTTTAGGGGTAAAAASQPQRRRLVILIAVLFVAAIVSQHFMSEESLLTRFLGGGDEESGGIRAAHARIQRLPTMEERLQQKKNAASGSSSGKSNSHHHDEGGEEQHDLIDPNTIVPGDGSFLRTLRAYRPIPPGNNGCHPPRITLVLHAFAGEMDFNTRFLLRHGVYNDGVTDFVFILNGGSVTLADLHNEMDEPLPNVHLMVRENHGFDFCSWRDALDVYGTRRPYTHFILKNRSIRGPFLPAYVRESWTNAMLNMLDDETGATGISINCGTIGDIPLGPDPNAPSPLRARSHMHIQSMLLALDVRAAKAFYRNVQCHDHEMDTIVNNELNTTRWFLLQEHVSIRPLMLYWKYVDMHDPEEVLDHCNKGGWDPFPLTAEPIVEGLFINPLESIFYKTNRYVTKEVEVYTRWMEENREKRLKKKREGGQR